MIYFVSNIYKWTLTLLTVETSLAMFAIHVCFMQSAGMYALIRDGRKNHESTYYDKKNLDYDTGK